MSEIKLNDQNFEQEVLKADLPVIVDFYATWCGPCQLQSPIIEDLAKEYAGKIKFGIMDVDDNPNTASQHQIFSIPTLIIFDKGQPVERLTGLQQKGVLKEKLDKLN
jgi:thioredoxin 1